MKEALGSGFSVYSPVDNLPGCIDLPYLLVISIPVYLDPAGRRWVDALWHKDLMLHLDYLGSLTIACPCVRSDEPPSGFLEVVDKRLGFVDLPDKRRQSTRFFETAWLLWQAVGRSAVVHHAVGAWWPLSMHYLAAAFARLRGRFVVVVVESAPWRLTPGQGVGLWQRVKSHIAETLGRCFVNAASLSVFTQEGYMDSLLSDRKKSQGCGHVIHASWIDSASIVERGGWEDDWRRKCEDGPLRIIFAGRLVEAKGVRVLLDAFARADASGCQVHLDVIGTGDMLEACKKASGMTWQVGRLRVLESVPYGAAFFSLLRNYHAVVVPSVSDEQPRIVYDAYAQGVPVLASDTQGLTSCVAHDVTGRIFAANDPGALLEVLQWAQGNYSTLRHMGEAGMQRAAAMTHKQMHAQRHGLLVAALGLASR